MLSSYSTRWCTLLLAIFIRVQLSWANVEKTIFVAPTRTSLPGDAALNNLLLDVLHPLSPSKRVLLNATLPTVDNPHGQETWILLEGLRPSQRYEIRVCWLATQPTSFWLDTFDLATALETPELITSISTYSYARHDSLSAADVAQLKSIRDASGTESSLLFLRVQAAADYFSTNKTLMEFVPAVHADVILDPYMLNIFPQSLLPTAAYIVVIAVSAWLLSGWVQAQLLAYISLGSKADTTKKSQ